MKSLTVNTKKFTKDELKQMIKLFKEEKNDVEQSAELFEEFIKDPADSKWRAGKFRALPQELMGVVVMLKEMVPNAYEEAVDEFVKPHQAETFKKREDLSRIIVKLQMRQK